MAEAPGPVKLYNLAQMMISTIERMFRIGADGMVRSEVRDLHDGTCARIKALGPRRFAEELGAPMWEPDWTPEPCGVVVVPKEKGGHRMLQPPTDEDRIRQRAIYNITGPHLDKLMSPNSYGFRPGRSALQAVVALKQAMARPDIDTVILADVANCFPSIPVARVLQEFREHIGDRHLLRWIEAYLRNRPQCRQIDLVATRLKASGKGTEKVFKQLQALHQRRVGVPQGSAIGPVACGLYLRPIVARIERELGDAALVHYADNLAIACRRGCLQRLSALLVDAGQQRGLTLGEMVVVHKGDDHSGEFLGYKPGWRAGEPHLYMTPATEIKVMGKLRELADTQWQDLPQALNETVLPVLAYFRLADFGYLLRVCEQGMAGYSVGNRLWAQNRVETFIKRGRCRATHSGSDGPPVDWPEVVLALWGDCLHADDQPSSMAGRVAAVAEVGASAGAHARCRSLRPAVPQGSAQAAELQSKDGGLGDPFDFEPSEIWGTDK